MKYDLKEATGNTCIHNWTEKLDAGIHFPQIRTHPKHPNPGCLGCFGWVRMSSNPKINGTTHPLVLDKEVLTLFVAQSDKITLD